ncbi:MAG TPA: response regulator [bacterium]|nr:response regulator [bacterium]
MKFLLTDDSAFMRNILKNLVAESWPDVEILEAGNGNDCIDIFRTQHPDLILLDMIMPGKEGIDVLEEIGSEATVVVISAVGQEEMINDAKDLGAKDFINKPFDKGRVTSTIKTVLGI